MRIVLMTEQRRKRRLFFSGRSQETAKSVNSATATKLYRPNRRHSLPSSERAGSTEKPVASVNHSTWSPRSTENHFADLVLSTGVRFGRAAQRLTSRAATA